MSRQVLWKLSIATSPQAEEEVAELLETRFGEPASIYTDLEKGKTTVTAYLRNRPDWSNPAQAGLRQTLKRIEGAGRSWASSRITLVKIHSADWAEAWKRHFKPLEVSRKLLIKPSWSRRRAKAGQAEVVIDPGLSFGTGQHPTTSFCLKELVRQRKSNQSQSFLDIGTGSGILAISAAKLGYQPIDAFDIDGDAIRVARANGTINGVSALIGFQCQDLTRAPRLARHRYTVICANLMFELVLAQKDRLLARLQSGGVLVLAGILQSEFPRVQAVYEAAGLSLVRTRKEREWRSGVFRSV